MGVVVPEWGSRERERTPHDRRSHDIGWGVMRCGGAGASAQGKVGGPLNCVRGKERGCSGTTEETRRARLQIFECGPQFK